MTKARGYLLMIGATLALAGVVLFVGLTGGKVPEVSQLATVWSRK